MVVDKYDSHADVERVDVVDLRAEARWDEVRDTPYDTMIWRAHVFSRMEPA